MAISIRSIATAVPPTQLKQGEVRDLFLAQPARSRLARRLVAAAFDASAIDTRHTVVDELGPAHRAGLGSAPALFYDAGTEEILSPGTGTRNAVYADRAPALFLDAARRALAQAPGIEAGDVTHVVTVSCTGFFAPGPDFMVVRDLGLSPRTQRYHLGFMGCYAAFPALRAAHAFCSADPEAVVLVVCVELCSLHLSASDDPDTIVASSVFADGAAAAVVTARPEHRGGPASGEGADGESSAPVLELDAFESTVTPVGEGDMAWTIGDHGFEMVLSRYVPAIIGEHIDGALAPLLARDPGLTGPPAEAVDLWAVHPGGRSILDKVQHALDLSDAQMAPSRATLRDYGNMSSATVLFILESVLRDAAQGAQGAQGSGHPGGPRDGGGAVTTGTGAAAGTGAARRVCAMAFGPGLTVESALLTLRPAGDRG